MALRRERQVPAVYFGRPGKLMTLPWPKGGLAASYERQTYDFVTGSGMHQVSSLATGSRPYAVSWEALHLDNFNKLAQYRIGANGPGPWAIIDPSVPNLLPPNVAAATGLFNDKTHLVTAGGDSGVIESNSTAAFIHRTSGWRSIRWRFLVNPINAFPVLSTTPLYRNWFGHPVMTGLPYTFSAWITPDGTIETNATIALKLKWLDAAGGQLSESSGGDIAVSTWQRLSVTATAPANAAYVSPIFVATGSSLVVNGSIYLDELMLEQDSVLNDWAPSTGLRPVEILGLEEGVPFETRMRTGATLTLRELSR